MKKKVLSPEKAKIISSLLVSMIFLFIVLSMTRLYTNRMIEKAQSDYFNTIKTTMDGFEKVVSLQLNSYRNFLDAYYKDILLTIPYGQTVSYGDIARLLAERRGIPRMSSQAVGGAVGHNPVSLIVPCHRVIGTGGSLTGYGGGLWRKKELLLLEGSLS